MRVVMNWLIKVVLLVYMNQWLTISYSYCGKHLIIKYQQSTNKLLFITMYVHIIIRMEQILMSNWTNLRG